MRARKSTEAELSKNASQQNRVMAVFHGVAPAFDLPPDTTLAELAEELGMLGEFYGGIPR